MDLSLISTVETKMKRLNENRRAVIFVVTGGNGSGKTVITKRLLTSLPFHQTYNLGVVAKTIRYIFQDEEVTRLENFTNSKVTSLFTPIVQFACSEYQKNGVNVIIDGVQVDTGSDGWQNLITGGVVLRVEDKTRIMRNQNPETHFNRKMKLELTDNITYATSEMFVSVDNSGDISKVLDNILSALSDFLDAQLAILPEPSTKKGATA